MMRPRLRQGCQEPCTGFFHGRPARRFRKAKAALPCGFWHELGPWSSFPRRRESRGPRAPAGAGVTGSELLRLHEAVEGRFREAEPQVLVGAELGVVFVDLLPARVL